MEPSPVAGLIIPLLLTILIAVIANILARQKGRNVVAWTVLGAIPLLNFMIVWYFVGATNLRVEKKIEDLRDEIRKLGLAGQ